MSNENTPLLAAPVTDNDAAIAHGERLCQTINPKPTNYYLPSA